MSNVKNALSPASQPNNSSSQPSCNLKSSAKAKAKRGQPRNWPSNMENVRKGKRTKRVARGVGQKISGDVHHVRDHLRGGGVWSWILAAVIAVIFMNCN